MRNFLKILLIIFIAYNQLLLAGTTGKITGIVKSKGTGEALIGATIIVNSTTSGAVTDLDGKFIILNIPPGNYTLTVSSIGYSKISINDVRVKIDQTTNLVVELESQDIVEKTITITAAKPPVELDLTASKQSVTASEINNSWARDVQALVSDLPGVNVNGGIRGGFGLDVAYHLDGLDMRDVGSNTNFTGVNMTTIQELEVLTGGWNAEYGQANGAIVNIVTKNSADRIRAVYSYKTRAAGLYHWGDNIYSQNDVFHTIATTSDFWDPNKTWQTEWMTAPLKGYAGGSLPFTGLTPQQKAEWWKNFINDTNLNPQIEYATRREWESEVTIYGPLPIPDLNFMLSARYKEGAPIYPSALKYNPDYTIQGNLNYRIGDTKIDVNGIYTKFANSQAPRTNYGTSEDTFNSSNALPFVSNPFPSGNGNGRYSYWFWGSSSQSNSNIRPPEYADMFNIQTKITTVFDAKTYLEIALQHSETNYESNFFGLSRASIYGANGLFQDAYLPTYGLFTGNYSALPTAFWTDVYDRPGDIWNNSIKSASSVIKADFTKQITEHHLLKTGIIFSYNMFDKVLHDHQSSGTTYFAHVTDLSNTKDNPYEGAIYLQDKIEYEGMVVNAGVRVDFYDANKYVSSNVFDPLMISDATEGHTGPVGHISYNPNGGPGEEKTKMQVAFSPRIGISHPITENTVLHFMYGKFNQRPAWQKIVGPTVVRTLPPAGLSDWSQMNPDVQSVYYNFFTNFVPNPGLTWERMTQYEIGIDQNIADMFQLNVTMYYKDANDLTSNGIYRGANTTDNIMSSSGSSGGAVTIRMYGDPRDPTNRAFGVTQGYFNMPVNGAWANVRGIEATLNTKFKNFNARLNYTLSILARGTNYNDVLYKQFPDTILGINHYSGASNTDGGGNGLDDQTWNPHNSFTLKLSLTSPSDFGPELGGINILGDWDITTVTSFAQGQQYTYHSPNDVSTEPNNRRWRDRWNTNLNLAKRFKIYGNLNAKLFIQVQNLFNDQQLRLFSGTDMKNYQEQGLLPFDTTTKQPMVWDWYVNNPRQIYFGFQIDF